MLADVTADLPGGAQAELSGATSGPRLDMKLRLRAARPRELAASLGLPAALPIPSEAAEGEANLTVEGASLAASDIALRFGAANRVSGGVTWRAGGPRPALALGLEADELRFDGAAGDPLAVLREAAERMDLALRLAAARVAFGEGRPWRRVALDAAAEQGRAALRSLAAERDGAEFQLSGALALGAAPRLSDAVLEARGAASAVLAPVYGEGWWRGPAAMLPLRLRASAQGAPEALQWRAEADFADARAEAQGAANTLARRGQGTATLRHPGAVRFLDSLGLPAPWLGPGSLSLIASLTAEEGGRVWQMESAELVAGEARLRAQGAYSRGGEGGGSQGGGSQGGGSQGGVPQGAPSPGAPSPGALASRAAAPGPARPRLTGRVQAEELPLPDLALLLAPGLPFDAEVVLAAQRAHAPGWPVLEEVSGELRAGEGGLRLDAFRARVGARVGVGGGVATGAVAFEAGTPPALVAELRLADAMLSAPLTGGVPDLDAGRVSAQMRLRAEGHSPAALLATLSGEALLDMRAGLLRGLDLAAAARAMALREPAAAEAALRAALAGGATAFEALSARLAITAGEARIEEGALAGEGGLAARIAGSLDLARGTQALRFALQPVEGPDVALRLQGPRAAPRRSEEIGEWLRWLSSR